MLRNWNHIVYLACIVTGTRIEGNRHPKVLGFLQICTCSTSSYHLSTAVLPVWWALISLQKNVHVLISRWLRPVEFHVERPLWDWV
jgi:hypothetical protein